MKPRKWEVVIELVDAPNSAYQEKYLTEKEVKKLFHNKDFGTVGIRAKVTKVKEL